MNIQLKEESLGRSKFFAEIIPPQKKQHEDIATKRQRKVAAALFKTLSSRLEDWRENFYQTHEGGIHPNPEQMMAAFSQVDGIGEYDAAGNTWSYWEPEGLLFKVTAFIAPPNGLIGAPPMLTIGLAKGRNIIHLKIY